MSETSIQEKIQGVIQSLPLFADADVVINDWSIFDRPNVNAPYVLIESSDNFESLHEVHTPETLWGIPIILVEAFTDWKETYDNFQERRQQVIDTFAIGGARAGDGLNIQRIHNDTPISPYYDKMIPAELQSESMPIFIMQRIILESKEY